MGHTTPLLALPYPDPVDAPDVPYWLQQLAETVEASLGEFPDAAIYPDLGDGSTSSTVYADLSGTSAATFSTPRDLFCTVAFGCRHKTKGTALSSSAFRLKIEYPDATITNSVDAYGKSLGEGYQRSHDGSDHLTTQVNTIHAVLPAGTTTFTPQGYIGGASEESSFIQFSIAIVPVRWASTTA